MTHCQLCHEIMILCGNIACPDQQNNDNPHVKFVTLLWCGDYVCWCGFGMEFKWNYWWEEMKPSHGFLRRILWSHMSAAVTNLKDHKAMCICLLLRTVICYHGNCDATKIVWLTFSSMIWESFAWCPGSRQRQCAGQETGWDINCFVTLSSLWYSLSIITRGTCPSPRVTCHACLLPGDRSRLSRRWEPSWSWTVSCSGAGGASPPCKCQWSAQWLQCSYSDCLHLEHFLDLQCLLPVWECEWEEWWWLLLESISWNMDQSYFSIRSIYQVIKISTSK